VASKPKKPFRREIARKGKIKTYQPKEVEPKDEESLRTEEEKVEESVSLNKEATSTEPSAITTHEIEKSQEPNQEQVSDSTTKEEIKPPSEEVKVPEVVKQPEVKKAVGNVNYLDGIRITNWSLYVAWGFPTIHHVTIENTNDIAYRDIKIQAIYYYSYSTTTGITELGRATRTLPITLSPHSKETYLENGTHLEQSSACSMYIPSGDIEVLGATPIEKTNIQGSREDGLLLELTDNGLFLVR